MTTDTRQSLRDQYQALEDIINRDDEAPWEFVSGITFVQGALTVLVDAIDADLTVPDALVQRWQNAAAEIIDMYPEDDEDDEPCPACGAAAGEPCDPTALEDFDEED
jgi:hypothetical protein